MDPTRAKHLSKFMSLLLRHRPQAGGRPRKRRQPYLGLPKFG